MLRRSTVSIKVIQYIKVPAHGTRGTLMFVVRSSVYSVVIILIVMLYCESKSLYQLYQYNQYEYEYEYIRLI